MLFFTWREPSSTRGGIILIARQFQSSIAIVNFKETLFEAMFKGHNFFFTCDRLPVLSVATKLRPLSAKLISTEKSSMIKQIQTTGFQCPCPKQTIFLPNGSNAQ